VWRWDEVSGACDIKATSATCCKNRSTQECRRFCYLHNKETINVNRLQVNIMSHPPSSQECELPSVSELVSRTFLVHEAVPMCSMWVAEHTPYSLGVSQVRAMAERNIRWGNSIGSPSYKKKSSETLVSRVLFLFKDDWLLFLLYSFSLNESSMTPDLYLTFHNRCLKKI